MKLKVAVLIDGEWFRIALENDLRGKLPNGVTAEVLYKNALLAIEPKCEHIFRIFYYDSEPHVGKATNPISRKTVDCMTPAKVQARRRFFSELGAIPLVALRRGVIRARNWVLRMGYVKKLLKGGTAPPLTDADVMLSMTQKGVDMRIGIDVATLSLKRHVDRIILISGDMDMIPAMKLARREGVQVVIVELVGRRVSPELVEDADFLRCTGETILLTRRFMPGNWSDSPFECPSDQKQKHLRMRAKFLGPDECWEWQQAPNDKNGGYGRTKFDGKRILAHRLSWEAFKG